METLLRISLLLVSLVISAYAKNPHMDHIFVFTGEALSIDCVGGSQSPILKYREQATDDPKIYFFEDQRRDGTPDTLIARAGDEKHDFYYEVAAAEANNGGEYECDWTEANDETNHYVNVIDKSSLVCPSFAGAVNEGEAADGLECSISKFGTVIHAWLNNASLADAFGLKFGVVDAEGNPVKVVHEETQTKLTAKVIDLTLTKAHNGTTLKCVFESLHETKAECESNAAQVLWKASGLQVNAPANAEIGEAFEAKCDLVDAGNPEATPVFKVNGVETTEATITPTADQVPAVNVSCIVGEMVENKEILLHSGPESIEPSVAKIVAQEGAKMDFGCKLPVAAYPEAVIGYKIGGTDVEPNATAKAEYNGETIICTAVNKVSSKKVSATIPLDIQFKPAPAEAEAKMELEQKSKAILDCTMDGNPAPTYAWSFIADNSSPKTSVIETVGAEHVIAELGPASFGEYVCTASNTEGSATKKFILTEKMAEGGNTAVIVIVVIIILILLVAAIIAFVLFRRRQASQETEDANKDKDVENVLLEDDNVRPDAPVQSEDEDDSKKESEDDKKDPLDSKESTPSPSEENKDSQPENPEKTNLSESPV